MLRVVVASTVLLLVTACGGGGSGSGSKGDDELDASKPGKSKLAKVIDASDAIAETGFAQDDDYLNAVAILDNPIDDPGYGHEVDVAFQLLDADGKVVGKVTGYSAFAWAGQRLAVMVQVDDAPRVASVRATAKLRVDSDPEASPVKPARGRIVDDFAELTIVNSREKPLTPFELVVVCRDKKGRINAVGSEDVDGAPASGKAKISAAVVGSETSDDCLGYPGVGI
jgi:hypothetical protein